MPPVAILFHRLGPYHVARLKAAAGRFPVVAVELTTSDRTYDWRPVDAPDLERLTIFEDRDVYAVSRREMNRRIQGGFERLQPRAVAIPGWSDPGALAALRWCGATGTPAVAMSESQAEDSHRRPWKEAVKRRLVRLCSSAVAGGKPQAAYLASLGMPADRIFTGYDVVDNDHFRQGADAARRDDAALRRQLGLPERYFLASSRFVEKKNLPRLIAAFRGFRESGTRDGWKLVLLGDGPLREKIVAEISRLGLDDSVVLPGFRQYEELPAYYGLASAFIHGSTVEQWGLVVNEAMAAGLPVLVSNRCGCATDLVETGKNGFTFDPRDTETLAGLMRKLAESEGARQQMGEASARIIADWPASRFGEALEKAVACAAAPRRATAMDLALLRVLMERAA